MPHGYFSQAWWAISYARRLLPCWANFGELRLGEVRRIPIPRTSVNKRKKKGWGLSQPRPFLAY